MRELKDISIYPHSEQSLQNQLYQAIRDRILNSRYPAGLNLPSSRLLAQELKVSRNTVLLAIEQLRAEGYIETKRGSGTYVTELTPDQFSQVAQVETSGVAKKLSKSSSKAHSTQTKLAQNPPLNPNSYFAPGVPDLVEFPQTTWTKLLKTHHTRIALMGFDSHQGYAPLRKAIANYLTTSRACRCHEGQIIITAGAQEAISLTAQVILNQTESVYVENPGYVNSRSAFQNRGCNLIGVKVDEQGIIPAHLPQKPVGKLLCLTPTHQYPMGGILSLQRRMAVIHWLKKHGVWLLEDDYDSEFHFYQRPVAAMQGLGLADQVIYVGSFSKVLFPALRLGYLLVPESQVEKFVTAKSHLSGENSLLEQAVTADFISEGHFNRHLLRMRKNYELKFTQLLALCQNIPGVKVVTPGAGMHIVLQFIHATPNKGRYDGKDAKYEDKYIAEQLSTLGVNARPLSFYYLGRAKLQGLVLGFANANHSQIIQGMNIISTLLKQRLKLNNET